MAEHAQPQTEELKKHGDILENAEKSTGEFSSKEEQQDKSAEQKKSEK